MRVGEKEMPRPFLGKLKRQKTEKSLIRKDPLGIQEGVQTETQCQKEDQHPGFQRKTGKSFLENNRLWLVGVQEGQTRAYPQGNRDSQETYPKFFLKTKGSVGKKGVGDGKNDEKGPRTPGNPDQTLLSGSEHKFLIGLIGALAVGSDKTQCFFE